MRNKLYITLCLSFLASCSMYDKTKPPIAPQVAYSTIAGTHKIYDEYAWLRDPQWPGKMSRTAILSYLNAENDYADYAFFDKNSNLREFLFKEMKARIALEDSSYPIVKDDYIYYTRFTQESSHPIYCRKKMIDTSLFNSKMTAMSQLALAADFLKGVEQEEVLLDINQIIKNNKGSSVGNVAVNPSHNLVAYTFDTKGKESYSIKIFDTLNDTYLKDHIEEACSVIVWHKKLNGFFYVKLDKESRPTSVMFHDIDSKKDTLVHAAEQGSIYTCEIESSTDGSHLMIYTTSCGENDLWTLDIKNSEQLAPELIAPIKKGVVCSADHKNGSLYLLINDKSENNRIVQVEHGTWKEVIPPGDYISSFALTKSFMLINRKVDGLAVIHVIDTRSGKSQRIKFDDPSYEASIECANFDLDDIRVRYSSLKTPDTLYGYDFDTNKLTTLKTKMIPSGFDPSDYVLKRLLTDGGVPITLMYKHSLFDGSNPTYLYGYGSYGISIPSSFRPNALSLIDRGFVYAIAHIRGGSELGREWYLQAKFLNKKRTFEDFIESAEFLIKNKYSSKGKIVIHGGSAGGMLVGYVINNRPDLYKAAIAEVPFVDVLNTMLDTTLPLTLGEFEEWGNPAASDEYFSYIQSYSPYDNVKPQEYPHLFVRTSINDIRVGYWEAAKWVARIRKNKTDQNLLILKTDMHLGHKASEDRFEYLKEVADLYSFAIKAFDDN